MVTRLPGTFGNAYEPIGSTVSSVEPGELPAMQSGSTSAEIASTVCGKAFATRKAQARPAMRARCNGRASDRASGPTNVAGIVVSPLTSFRDGPKDQTSGAQLRTGESRDSGFDASHRPGMTAFCY